MKISNLKNENEILKEEDGEDSVDRAKYFSNLQELVDSLQAKNDLNDKQIENLTQQLKD